VEDREWDVAQFNQLGADGFGIPVGEFGQDGQRSPPGVTGGNEIAGRLAGVADAGEGPGLVVAVTAVAEQTQRALIGGAGLGMVAEAVVGETEAVLGPA
jgi:hypothetical protein